MYFRNRTLVLSTIFVFLSAFICMTGFKTFASIDASEQKGKDKLLVEEAQEYFTQKFLFEDPLISVLEEQVEMTVKEDFQVQKKVEYLIKNNSQKDEITVFFATEEGAPNLLLTLDGVQIDAKEKLSASEIQKDFQHKTFVNITDPLSKTQQNTEDFRIAFTPYRTIYKITLPVKKGEFGKITLQYPSKSIISKLEPLINPIYTQTHQITPSKHFVNGAVVTLRLILPESLKFASSIALNQNAQGNYIAILDKTLYSNWDINLISSEGLIFMSNKKAQNNETLLKTLGASFLFSIILYLVSRRELTKKNKTQFAPLKSGIFRILSLLLYLISIALIYFFKLPSPFDEYWNYIYFIILLGFSVLSYLAYRYRTLFHFNFVD